MGRVATAVVVGTALAIAASAGGADWINRNSPWRRGAVINRTDTEEDCGAMPCSAPARSSLEQPATNGSPHNFFWDAVEQIDDKVQHRRKGNASEWVLVDKELPVNVRSEKSISAPIIGIKNPEEVVVGVREGDWLALTNEVGFMMIFYNNGTLLREREASYVRITEGNCAAVGLSPITAKDACEVAAAALALSDLTVASSARELSAVVDAPIVDAPEGCYLDAAGSLQLNTDPEATGAGSSGALQQICSTAQYPTSTSTTRTTTTVTSTTSTVTTTARISEWQAGARLNVRANRSLEAEILDSRPAGSIFLGRPEGSWLRLVNEPGFVKISLHDGQNTLLYPWHVSYILLDNGTCTGLGHQSIRVTEECEAAAEALGLSDTNVEISEEGTPYEGCHLKDGASLWMSSGGTYDDNTAFQHSKTICASRALPSSTTTTTSTLTTSTTSSKGSPSLFCFSVMRHHTVEEELIKMQLKHFVSIFACDETVVISAAKVLLGVDRVGEEVWTWKNPAPDGVMGNLAAPGVTTNSWLNTQVFITAFGTLMTDTQDRIWHNDWVVKADPDAVLFPDRLRWHLKDHTGQPNYIVNCNHGGWKLFGSIEAFSNAALLKYHENTQTCLNMDWHGWGEDSYMQRCMDTLGVAPVPDFGLVGDARCNYAPCSDGTKAAFHPFKDIWGWRNCWQQSTGKSM